MLKCRQLSSASAGIWQEASDSVASERFRVGDHHGLCYEHCSGRYHQRQLAYHHCWYALSASSWRNDLWWMLCIRMCSRMADYMEVPWTP